MNFLCPGGVRCVGKSESRVGLDNVVIRDVEVNALKINSSVLAIKHSDGLGKYRRQRDPVMTQHKPTSVIVVKVAQSKRAQVTAGCVGCPLAGVGDTPRYDHAIVHPKRKQLVERLGFGSRADSGVRYGLVEFRVELAQLVEILVVRVTVVPIIVVREG